MPEKLATGISPAVLTENEAGSPASRRGRVVDAGSFVVAEALSAKLMHGWLQNRHQTLMPLTLNLLMLRLDQQLNLAKILASLLLAGRPTDQVGSGASGLRLWLSGLGASAEIVRAFDEALVTPFPLNVVFEIAQAEDLTIYSYVAALMASDPRYPVSVMLSDIVQTRFALPTALVRSAIRRYRR